MKLQQCPACKQKLDLKRAAAVKKVNRALMLQCVNCQQWSYESQQTKVIINLGLLMLISGSVMGYFQLGGIILGPSIAVAGGLIALAVKFWATRIAVTL